MAGRSDLKQRLLSATCVLFDMDGVLVDVSHSYRRAILETAQHFLRKEIDPTVIQSYKNRGGFNDDWELTHAIVQDGGGGATIDEVTEIFQRLYRGGGWDGYISDETSLLPAEDLHDLRSRYSLGIVTGRPEAEACWTISHFGWRDSFPVVIAKEQQEGRTKPDPFPIEKALTEFGARGHVFDPGRTVYVGDTVDDMRASTAAGTQPVGFVPPYLPSNHAATLYEVGAAVVVHSMKELRSVLDAAR